MRSTTSVFRDPGPGGPISHYRQPRIPELKILPSLFGAFFLILNCLGTLAHAEESHPGLALEAKYTQAVISFNHRQMEETIQTLDSILKESPENLPALEL